MDFGRLFQIEYFTAKKGYPVISPGNVDRQIVWTDGRQLSLECSYFISGL